MADAAQPFRTSHSLGVHEAIIASAHVELVRLVSEMERLGLSEVALRSRLLHVAQTLHPDAVRELVEETWAKSPYSKRPRSTGVLVDLHGGREA